MKLLRILLIIVSLFLSYGSYAYDCSPNPSILTIPSFTFSPADTAGKVYWTTTITSTSNTTTCNPLNTSYNNESICTGADYSAYNTQLASAGLQFIYKIRNSGQSYSGEKNGNSCTSMSSTYTSTGWPLFRLFLYNAVANRKFLGGGNGGSIEVNLVRNSIPGTQLSAITLPAGTILQNIYWGGGSSSDANIQIKLGTTLTIAPSTCKVNSPTVNLGTHASNEFSAVNTATSTRTAFQLTFTCPANSANANYYFNPASDASIVNANTGVFSLYTSATAKGVGIQVTNASGTGICFGNTCLYSVGNAGNAGTFTKTWYAAYYKTKPSITPGTANSGLTITIIYQ
ncbi:MAG: hypothetical protein LEGION0398_MBIBDBAK_01076 [Legionellaceae bacterium]